MNELEKMMNNLPKLMYELKNETLVVLGFQSQSSENALGKLGINPIKEASHYFYELNDLYKGELDDNEYNKRLVYLYKKIQSLLDDYPADICTSRKRLEILTEADDKLIKKQVQIYKYIRSVYSRYN